MDKVMYDLEPSEFFLSQNYPNPFNEKTTIKFCIAYKTKVRIEIFDPEGKLIKTLLEGEKEAGSYEAEFDAHGFSEGVYIYQIRAGNFLETKKMILLR